MSVIWMKKNWKILNESLSDQISIWLKLLVVLHETWLNTWTMTYRGRSDCYCYCDNCYTLKELYEKKNPPLWRTYEQTMQHSDHFPRWVPSFQTWSNIRDVSAGPINMKNMNFELEESLTTTYLFMQPRRLKWVFKIHKVMVVTAQ